MIVAYDPVAGEVEIHLDGGLPPLVIRTRGLQVKYYGEMLVSCQMRPGGRVELVAIPDNEEPSEVFLLPTGELRWQLRFRPARR